VKRKAERDRGRRPQARRRALLLAAMHGTSYFGDGAAKLRDLGDHYDARLRATAAWQRLAHETLVLNGKR
jgi:hypothetical protein